MIDQLTLPEAEALCEYWIDFPPARDLMHIQVGYERPLSTEEKISRGAMGPADFLEHYKRTGGKINRPN